MELFMQFVEFMAWQAAIWIGLIAILAACFHRAPKPGEVPLWKVDNAGYGNATSENRDYDNVYAALRLHLPTQAQKRARDAEDATRRER